MIAMNSLLESPGFSLDIKGVVIIIFTVSDDDFDRNKRILPDLKNLAQ